MLRRRRTVVHRGVLVGLRHVGACGRGSRHETGWTYGGGRAVRPPMLHEVTLSNATIWVYPEQCFYPGQNIWKVGHWGVEDDMEVSSKVWRTENDPWENVRTCRMSVGLSGTEAEEEEDGGPQRSPCWAEACWSMWPWVPAWDQTDPRRRASCTTSQCSTRWPWAMPRFSVIRKYFLISENRGIKVLYGVPYSRERSTLYRSPGCLWRFRKAISQPSYRSSEVSLVT